MKHVNFESDRYSDDQHRSECQGRRRPQARDVVASIRLELD
jgi:hypothetical protein